LRAHRIEILCRERTGVILRVVARYGRRIVGLLLVDQRDLDEGAARAAVDLDADQGVPFTMRAMTPGSARPRSSICSSAARLPSSAKKASPSSCGSLMPKR
jgi:hypothetical protein